MHSTDPDDDDDGDDINDEYSVYSLDFPRCKLLGLRIIDAICK